ncbi:EF2563 family selenium-dependent molybdenum hydroxylase system protein [bacterium]|nr:EF2563 family selenium-dependent molybdenum hydroxylase system protein [bacterium]MCB2179419.1 EF2563 family selenium-dependent molybdenum hydroxylase system protein [bacterium]
MHNKPRVIVRGGGDLASGVAARLHRTGFAVLVLELAHPLVVRRLVSFAEAVFKEDIQVEDIRARRAADLAEVEAIQAAGQIAVMVDPEMACLEAYEPLVLVDARMMKRKPEYEKMPAPLVIGLGPGFTAGEDCHAVVETIRGHMLGRVIWDGPAAPDTGIPDTVLGINSQRVLRAPADGVLVGEAEIGDLLKKGDRIARVGEAAILAPFDGALRGLVKSGLEVYTGLKVGDLDPRNDPLYARLISDKSLAIGGGVLEAIFSQEAIRKRVYASG